MLVFIIAFATAMKYLSHGVQQHGQVETSFPLKILRVSIVDFRNFAQCFCWDDGLVLQLVKEFRSKPLNAFNNVFVVDSTCVLMIPMKAMWLLVGLHHGTSGLRFINVTDIHFCVWSIYMSQCTHDLWMFLGISLLLHGSVVLQVKSPICRSCVRIPVHSKIPTQWASCYVNNSPKVKIAMTMLRVPERWSLEDSQVLERLFGKAAT